MSIKIANRYEIIKTIGSGGMANVYLAYDTILNRQVAVKVLKADMADDDVALERFRREANASTKISHPNIVDIYDVGDDGDKHYIVMEYIKGYTLKQLIKRRGAIPPREAVWMIKQLAQALMEAHKNGLIHRDVKSQNVLIKDDGTIKLADFGIAVLNNALQLTSKDSVLGSVHYLAPELAKGASASMQSDIYSLGIVLYELLTGDVPYKADTPVQVALKQIKEPLPDVRKFNPQIPQSVCNILSLATAKDTSQRYSNIALMIKDLNICLDESHKNDAPIKIKSKTNDDSKDYNISSTAEKTIEKAKYEKSEKRFSTILIVSLSLISIIAIVVILFMSGVFSNNKTKYIEVPNVVGLTLASAQDAIDNSGLTIEYPVERKLTENAEAGIVVEINPSEGSEVEKGSKISLVVSSGKYSIMPDFVGENIDDVKKYLTSNIRIDEIDVVDEDKEEGTIISQKGIEAGEKYDSSAYSTITFEIVRPENINIPAEILGLSVDEAVDILEEQEFKVEMTLVDKDTLDNSITSIYKPNTVFKMDPNEGTLISKTDDLKIILYYYE